jgi:hypothetical protein
MSTDFRLRPRIFACDLFGGRLAKFGVRGGSHRNKIILTVRLMTFGFFHPKTITREHSLTPRVTTSGFISMIMALLRSSHATAIMTRMLF